VWTVWWVGGWEASGERATFWEMAWSAPRAIVDAPRQFWSDFYGPQFLAMLSILGVSFWIGLGIGWLRRIGDPDPDNGDS
jgi:hypothetical protein